MFFLFTLLITLFFVLLLCGIFIQYTTLVRFVHLVGTFLAFKFTLFICFFFIGFEGLIGVFTTGISYKFELLKVSLEYNFNGLSLIMLLLTIFLWFICVLIS